MEWRKVLGSKKRERGSEAGLTRRVKIVNSLGLHARPSALFVQTANRFPSCRITVSNGRESVNGKSIMGMMTLAAAFGTQLTIETAGRKAAQAMEALCELIADKFEEE
jgi:phosphocarrier protein